MNTPKEWIKDLSAYIFLALLVTLKFWDYLNPKGEFYWAGDFLDVTPMRDYFYHNLKKGIFILWDPYLATGMPYLAADYGVFYPIDLLLGVMSQNYFVPYRLSLVHAFHFWLGGVFTFIYTRQLGLSRIPALISSICFMLGGFLLGHAYHRNVIQTYIWLPLILYFLDKALLQRRVLWAVLAGVCLAVSFLAGHPNFFYFILLFLAGYFLFRVYLGVRQRSFHTLAGDTFYFFIMGVFCLGLSAVQLLPMIFTSLKTYRGTFPFEWKAQLPFPLINLVHFLIPDYTQWAATDIGEQYGFIGFLPLLFAVWGVIQSKDHRSKFFGILVLFAFIASLGELTPLYRILFHVLPGLNQFRIPARFNALIIFPLAILAGLGFQQVLDSLGQKQPKGMLKSIKVLLFLSLGIGVFIFLGLSFFLYHQEPRVPLWNIWGQLRKGFLWFLFIWGAAYLIISWRNRNPSIRFFNSSVVLLISIDLLFLGQIEGGGLKTNPALFSDQAQKIIKEIKKEPYPMRIGNPKRLLSSLLLYREGISAYDVGNLVGYIGTVVPQEYLELYFLLENNPRLLDLLNVKYVIGSKPNIPNGLVIRRIGGKFEDQYLPLRVPTKISRLTLLTNLSHSTSITQGAVVAQVSLINPKGLTRTIPIRAGIETAEWAIDHPGLICAHRKTQVSESWDMPGEGYKGHLFTFSATLPNPKEVSKIGLEYLSGQGSLFINKILIDDQEVDGLLTDRFQSIEENIYKNIFCLPRVFMIGRAKAVSDEKELLNQVEQLDPMSTILLSHFPLGYHEPLNSAFSTHEAEIKEYSSDKIIIITQADEDKFLVLSDTHSPFWKAWIDHNPSPILKVNYGLRSLYVPKGNHRIEFSFHFFPFYLGLGITSITLIGVILLSFGIIRRNYQKGKREAQ